MELPPPHFVYFKVYFRKQKYHTCPETTAPQNYTPSAWVCTLKRGLAPHNPKVLRPLRSQMQISKCTRPCPQSIGTALVGSLGSLRAANCGAAAPHVSATDASHPAATPSRLAGCRPCREPKASLLSDSTQRGERLQRVRWAVGGGWWAVGRWAALWLCGRGALAGCLRPLCTCERAGRAAAAPRLPRRSSAVAPNT